MNEPTVETGKPAERKPTRWPFTYIWEPEMFWGWWMIGNSVVWTGIAIYGLMVATRAVEVATKGVAVLESIEQVLRNRRP